MPRDCVSYRARNIVLDPVMVTTSGDPLIDDTAVGKPDMELFPLATLVTLTPCMRLHG
ncbi:MAG: bifunctional hydroxymethylpyrimidine kinase/phosphomethylpyrimidine kinase [Nitratireductor sp.]